MKFIRYGSLIPQKHNPDPESFHRAPVKSGFYAFPRGYVEKFLLGGIGEGSIENGRYRFVRDKSGNKIFCNISKLIEIVKEGYQDEKFKWHDDIKRFTPEYTYLTKKYNPSRVYRWWGPERKFAMPYPDDIDPTVDVESEKWDIMLREIEASETYFVEENKPNYFDYKGVIWFHGTEIVPMHERLKTFGSWVLTDIKTYERYLKKMTDRFKFYHWKYSSKSGSPGGYPIANNSKDEFEVFIEKLT